MPRWLRIDPDAFRAGFNARPFVIGHELSGHPLFSLTRLVELARSLPEHRVEYNAGDVPLTLDPQRTPRTGLSIEETIRRIEVCRSWMVLKNVEQDPEYRVLVEACLEEIGEVCEPLSPGMRLCEAFIFISSPGSITPYHMDPEHNFLLQIRGAKTVHMFDGADRTLLSERDLERFLSGGHRNLDFKDEYDAKAFVFELTPGKGLHFPVTFPHYVVNGSQVSVSFSVTFRSSASERRATVYKVNARLRRLGLAPTPVGRSPGLDAIKVHAFDAARWLAQRVKRGAAGYRGEHADYAHARTATRSTPRS
jgi:hypothetical protein